MIGWVCVINPKSDAAVADAAEALHAFPIAAARLAEELRAGEPDPTRLSITVLGAALILYGLLRAFLLR